MRDPLAHLRCLTGAGAIALLLLLFQTASAGELRFVQPDADAGEIRVGTALAHDFAFTVTGPDTLEILDLRASCGCLTPHLDRRLYQPGKRGTIRLEVNTLTQPAGLQSWRLQISYRTGKQVQEVALRLRAKMVQEITVRPAALVFVGDRALAHAITITDPRPHPLTVTEVRSSSPALTVALHPRAAASRQTVVDVRINPDSPPGRHDAIVSIYTDDNAYRELRVPVTVDHRARQRVVVRPQEVSLVAPPGQPVPSQLILLQDRDNQAVVIEQIRADDPAIRARWARGPGSMATVRIKVDRGRMHGSTLKSLIHIRLKRPMPQELVLPVSCQLE